MYLQKTNYTEQELDLFLQIMTEEEKERFGFSYFSSAYRFSERFMEKYAHLLDWEELSFYQTLSESFIEKYHNRVHWDNISQGQILSESFMDKWAAKLNWEYISEKQTMSKDFVIKHYDKLNPVVLMKNKKLSQETKDEVKMIEMLSGDFFKNT